MAGADSTATAVGCIFLHILINPSVYSRNSQVECTTTFTFWCSKKCSKWEALAHPWGNEVQNEPLFLSEKMLENPATPSLCYEFSCDNHSKHWFKHKKLWSTCYSMLGFPTSCGKSVFKDEIAISSPPWETNPQVLVFRMPRNQWCLILSYSVPYQLDLHNHFFLEPYIPVHPPP